MTLFSTAGNTTIPNPNNQWEMVLHTLIFPPKELSMAYWMNVYKSHKFSSRLGEIEKDLNMILVERKQKTFTNRFGHNSSYTVYVPILEQSIYIELYNNLQSKKSKP